MDPITLSDGRTLKVKRPSISHIGVIARLQALDSDPEVQITALGVVCGFVIDEPVVNAIPIPERHPESGKRTLGAWLDYGVAVADALVDGLGLTMADISALYEGVKAALESYAGDASKNS